MTGRPRRPGVRGGTQGGSGAQSAPPASGAQSDPPASGAQPPVAPEFALDGPLPTGTSLLEASAGTGKTYTIARLVSRYVAEGAATIDRLAVVSFGEASSRELRDRVRERLVADRDEALRDAAAPDGARDGDDRLAHDRLDRALADFDGAMVTTIHGLCHALLRELGTAADHDRDAVLLPDLSDVVDEVTTDLYVGRWGRPVADPAGVAGPPPAPGLTPGEFGVLARLAALDPATPLVPDPEDAVGDARLFARVAADARAEVARRVRAARLLTYDDMVLRLDAALRDPATADVALAHLRRRFGVVLVDEFQDTDPAQWRILRTAFHGHATLVLVGDPKQAIYGFRGADVHAYLDARRDATTTATLPDNHRSDPGVLDGLAALLGGAALGDPQIRVRPVRAAVTGSRLDAGPPVRLRVVQRDGHPVTGTGLIPVATARDAIRDDVARHVVALLAGDARLTERDGTRRRAHPGDVAVIVRTNGEAEAVRERLRAAGVPAVVSGRASVFLTPAAEAWQHLLEALEQPHRTARVRRLALGPLVGRTARTLEDDLDDLALRVRLWLRVLEDRGVAALAERVQADLRLPARLLRQPGGERLLTDLRHVAEVLHEEALRSGLGLTALTTWLHRRRSETDDQTVERSRRLETDAAAVQVLTSHTSKGLEFPVVLAPSLWDHWGPKAAHPRYHDATGRRVRDVGGPGDPGSGRRREHSAHVAANWAEDADEELRLAYVTLTRAAALVVAWWAPTRNSSSAPLSRLLLHDDPTCVAPLQVTMPSDAVALDRFRSRAEGSGGTLAVSAVPPPGSAAVGTWTPSAQQAAALRLGRLDRGVDLQWRRTSYSSLTRAAHEAAPAGLPGTGVAGSGSGASGVGSAGAGSAGSGSAGSGSAGSGGSGSAWSGSGSAGARGFADAGADGLAPAGAPTVGSEPDTGQKDDEADVTGPGLDAPDPGEPDAPLHDVPSAWADLAGGTGFGTLVHRILEHYEPGADLGVLVAATARRPGLDAAALTAALSLTVATPLGPLADGLAWDEVTAADRLPELEFELPLAGGDSPLEGGATLAGLAELWAEHVPHGLLAGYAELLAHLPAADPGARLRGYLTGSIDAVVRVGGAQGERYLVVDHKTNRLAPPDEPLTAWHYRAAALERAMVDAHYPLQALLYAVALHRYLRWRRRGYDPERHLGGVLYLFLRGMCGPHVRDAAGATPGVFSWRPPAGLVVATSALLAGGDR